MKTTIFLFILYTLLSFVFVPLSFAGYYDEYDKRYKAQQAKLAAAKIIVEKPNGNISRCSEVEEFFKYDTKKICEAYAQAKKKAEEKCLSRRINGDETEAGARQIRKICKNEGDTAGWKAANWFIRKEKVKSFFKK